MTEVYAWPEGNVWVWTGTAGSAVLAYVEGCTIQMAYGWENQQNLNGVYRDYKTGQRIDVSIQRVYSPGSTALLKWAESATAVHLHFKHLQSGLASANGIYVYSARIDQVQLGGREQDTYREALNMHANVWSAY